jgi:hypothetical protein
LTSQDLGLDGLLDSPRVREFIGTLELPDGGFKGASWDQAADVEYTFYALGTLGLLGAGGSPSWSSQRGLRPQPSSERRRRRPRVGGESDFAL